MELRLNRFLSAAGLGSRRAVEAFVLAGRVRINGEIVRDLATRVDGDRDEVHFDDRLVVARAAGRILLYHKPVGVVCSFRRQGDSRCLAEVFQDEFRDLRLFHIGRLDRDSSGLLLLGDDGDLANALTHPSHPVWKCYRVRATGQLSDDSLEDLRAGRFELDSKPCLPARIEQVASEPKAYNIQLREGRNRQIRRIFEASGLRIVSLHRYAIGPLELGQLPSGKWRDATPAELASLCDAAGLTPRQ